MQTSSEQIKADLQRVAHEIEDLLKASATGIADRAGEAVRNTQAEVEEARERVTHTGRDAQEDITRRAQAAVVFVRSNPWLAAGIAAAAGFLVGAIAARRD